MFGGTDGDESYNDVWPYDLATGSWSEQRPTGDLPAERSGQTMAYDPKQERVLVFGGTLESVVLDDTWAYDLNDDWQLPSLAA